MVQEDRMDNIERGCRRREKKTDSFDDFLLVSFVIEFVSHVSSIKEGLSVSMDESKKKLFTTNCIDTMSTSWSS